MKKFIIVLFVMTMVVSITTPALAVNMNIDFQGPRLQSYVLSLPERTYSIVIPCSFEWKTSAGPNEFRAEVEGRWVNGKATETISIMRLDALYARLIKTADCPQDPWLTDNPVYYNVTKSAPVLVQSLWDDIGPLTSTNSFYSANLFSETKAKLRSELAKTSPIIQSPPEGSVWYAQSPVKLTIRKHPDYSLQFLYEYRSSSNQPFESAFPPNTTNAISAGETFSHNVFFFLPGEWRVHARHDVAGSQFSQWLAVTVKAKKPVILSPNEKSSYLLRPTLGSPHMAVSIPIKIEHNYSETVTVAIERRPNSASNWAAVNVPLEIKKGESVYLTEGHFMINETGEYRFKVYSSLAREWSDWCEFQVKHPLKDKIK